MINILMSIGFCLLNFSIFVSSYRVIGVNRTMLNIPREYFYLSVSLTKSDSSIYFQKDTLENYVLDYFKRNVTKFTKKYNVDFFYYNPEDLSICTSTKCLGVEITLKTDLAFSYHYERTMYYEIRKMTK